jgi:hypothetical protein
MTLDACAAYNLFAADLRGVLDGFLGRFYLLGVEEESRSPSQGSREGFD